MESTIILAIIPILNFEINKLIQLFISKFEHGSANDKYHYLFRYMWMDPGMNWMEK